LEKCLDEIENIEKIMTMNGLLPISRCLGINLKKWEKI